MDRRLTLTIGYVVTAVWAASFICSIAIHDYNPDASIHAIMMLVAGAAFGGAIKLPWSRKHGHGADAGSEP